MSASPTRTLCLALVAAQAVTDVALAGGAGDDDWGRWLLARMRTAGVDLSLFDLIAGFQTARAFVSVDAAGKPSYGLDGDGGGTVARALEVVPASGADAGGRGRGVAGRCPGSRARLRAMGRS